MTYPFTAVVGQDEARLALLLCAVNPRIGGVILSGEKGTAKSTVVRGLVELLPGHIMRTLAPKVSKRSGVARSGRRPVTP